MEDLTGLGKTASSLSGVLKATIDKLGNAACIIYNDTDYKIRKEAEKKYIDRIINDDSIDETVKIALVSSHKQMFREVRNMQDITKIALSKLTEKADPESVNDDWISYFFDKAKNISEANIQIVWGNILANEINYPGTVPKTLIHTLSVISNEEAKNFNILCRYHVIYKGKYSLLYPNIKSLGDILSFDQITELVKLGLVYSLEFGYVYILDDCTDTYEFKVLDKCFLLKSTHKDEDTGKYYIKIGDVAFTHDGELLCKVINPIPAENIIDIIKSYYVTEEGYELKEIGTH